MYPNEVDIIINGLNNITEDKIKTLDTSNKTLNDNDNNRMDRKELEKQTLDMDHTDDMTENDKDNLNSFIKPLEGPIIKKEYI